MAMRDEYGWQEAMPRILGETLLCAAAMSLPFLLLGGHFAGMISAGIAIFWDNIAGLARRRGGGGSPEPSPESGKQSEPFAFSGVVAAFGVAALAYAAMMRWAYAPVAIPGELASILNPGFAIPALPVLLAAGVLAFQIAKRRGAGEPLQATISRVRQSWLRAFGSMAMFLALTVILGPPIAFYQIADMVALDRTPAAWEIFDDYPILMAAILLSALLAVSAPRGHDSEARRRTGTTIRVAGFPAALAVALYGCIHIAVVAATTSVPAFVSATLVGTEAFVWAAEQQANGVPAADAAATLNAHGHPAPLRADGGLADLLPEYSGTLDEMELRGDCTIALAAAVADPAEFEGMAWPEDIHSYSNAEAPREILDVKYCLRVTCPSIVRGDDRPMSAMFTSHPTNNPGWLLPLRFQLFYPDEDLNAGGYCTADGELAAEYQG